MQRTASTRLPDDPDASVGTRLARLAVPDLARTVAAARDLLARQAGDSDRDLAIDLIETILVHKFPTLSRDEIRIMLQLPETDLKKTRFYQEVFREGHEEGREEGREEGEQMLVLRQLKRRLGTLAPAQQSRIQALTADDLGALGEALLDFRRPADLYDWLRTHGA